MKNKLCTALLLAAAMTTLTPSVPTRAAELREHRAVWVTPFLSDWPTSAITTGNAATHRRYLTRSLDTFKESGINIVYFHVRSHCDANYRSKYEPWSKFVGGTRGNEPAFDPLEVLLEEAHARGIEVYAWVNPYRYCGVYTNGESPLDYENTHPEWLIVQSGKETILNPALEEVKQRICDVIADVIDNYDIDGVVFDDYFYSNPTPYDLDADLYAAAKAADPSVGTQLQWRVANVNDMVRRVSQTIKEHKPYLPFGISPAGIASPSNVTSEYGLQPIRGDWQYNAIASDPLNWYKNGYVDYMAPQIYWTDRFDEVESWWNIAGRKFGRHLYSAITLSEATYYGSELNREVEYAREIQADNTSGFSYFRMSEYINTVFRYEGAGVEFADFVGSHALSTPALAPIRPWNNVYAPAYVTNLRRDGSTLSWDAVEGMRYTIYAFAAGEEQRPFSTNLVQVTYTNSFAIPNDLADKTFGVAVYDRYGNEYSMTTEGGTPAPAVVATLTYPENGAKAADLFDFTWEDTGTDNVLEVASDAAFTDIISMTPTAASSVNSYVVPNLEEGKTYYWRVRTNGVNAPVGVSEVRSFVASRLSVTGPVGSDETLTPTISWTAAYEGSQYLVELSRASNFSTIAYSTTVDNVNSVTIPAEALLMWGARYYVRVTASRYGRTSTSDVASFYTAEVTPDQPKFINPAVDGATIHTNQCVQVEVPTGASAVVVTICASEDFTGGVVKTTLHQGETDTKELSTMRIKGKKLVDGTTYYVSAYTEYFTHDNQTSEVAGDAVFTKFVYSATEGVTDITTDDSDAPVQWFNLQGIEIAEPTSAGIYVRRQGARAVKVVLP